MATSLIEIVNRPDSFSECMMRLSCLKLVGLEWSCPADGHWRDMVEAAITTSLAWVTSLTAVIEEAAAEKTVTALSDAPKP